MASPAEQARLSAIRRRVGMLDGHEWLLGAVDGRMQVDARGPDGSLLDILTFTAHANSDEIQLVADALDDQRFLLSLLDRAFRVLRRQGDGQDRDRPAQDKVKPNHAAEAAMLCGEPAFKRFLMERHGLDSPATDDRAATKLRSVLGVTSRKEINEDEAVRARWIARRGEFHAWKGRARV